MSIALRGRHLLVFDLIASAGSFLLSLALRFDAPSTAFDSYLRTFAFAIPLLVGARLLAFLTLRLYQRVWRYASVEELVATAVAVLASSIVGYGLIFAISDYLVGSSNPFPKSVAMIDSVVVLGLTGAWRFGFRVAGIGRLGGRTIAGLERALIVGSGVAAIAVIRELRANSALGLHAVGLLADDLSNQQRVLGLPVLGRSTDLASVVGSAHVGAVLLALPAADGKQLRRLVRDAEVAGVRCLTVPSMAEVLAGHIRTDALREVAVEDLLRRAPARIDRESVSETFQKKRILITGAGGSIGSELARQLLLFKPSQLVLLGRGENSIFDALQTLEAGPTEIVPVILDIRDADRLHALFRDLRPEVVFHAAAHKHVTFMELYPEEAVATNVLGTLSVISASEEVDVDRFVLISSDKAVNPASVMGVTKRVSELLVLDAALRTGSRFATVRFGNVLSSRGSVVPIFKRQMERGGPITITDPEVSRFFMTIPEAVQLVMQAAALADPGDLFVLDMGERVKIVDLATDLLDLHGLKRGEDLEFEFIGLRPGEKLNEELLFPYERTEPTSHEAVRRIVHSVRPPNALKEETLELRRLVDLRQRRAIISHLHAIVPEYAPAGLPR